VHTNVSTDQFSIFILEVGAGTPTSGYTIDDLRAIVYLANVRLKAEVSQDGGRTWSLVVVGDLAALPAPALLDLDENHIYIGGADGQAEDRPVGGDLTVTNSGGIADFQIVEDAITGYELADESVTNAIIAGSTEFIDVQNAGGSSQFSVTNDERSKNLLFEYFIG